MIAWQWCRLDELTLPQQYAIYAARVAVFIVEQNCPYQELDGLDFHAHHLIGWHHNDVAAYLRVVEPGLKYNEPSIGRVLTAVPFRTSGYGRQLMQTALGHADRLYPGQGNRINAQAYLEGFYSSFGFVRCSEPYLEDNILHIEMLRP